MLTNSAIDIPVTISLSRPIAQKLNLLAADTPANVMYGKLPDFFAMKGTIGAPKEDIKKNYYDPGFRGIDIDARFKLSEDKMKLTKSNAEVFGIIAQTLLEFNDSHTSFVPPQRSARIDYGWLMKTFGDDYILRSKTAQPIEALHYSMTLPTSVIITGIDSLQVLDQAIEAARTFKPMTREEIAALLGRTREAALKGQLELYKISQHFDGTAKNPQWLG